MGKMFLFNQDASYRPFCACHRKPLHDALQEEVNKICADLDTSNAFCLQRACLCCVTGAATACPGAAQDGVISYKDADSFHCSFFKGRPAASIPLLSDVWQEFSIWMRKGSTSKEVLKGKTILAPVPRPASINH